MLSYKCAQKLSYLRSKIIIIVIIIIAKKMFMVLSS